MEQLMEQFAANHPYLNGIMIASAMAFWVMLISLSTYCIKLYRRNERDAANEQHEEE